MVKIINSKKSKNLYFCEYNPLLDEAINNFKSARTVKVIKNVCYIHRLSFGYFTEILSKNHVQFTIVTKLI